MRPEGPGLRRSSDTADRIPAEAGATTREDNRAPMLVPACARSRGRRRVELVEKLVPRAAMADASQPPARGEAVPRVSRGGLLRKARLAFALSKVGCAGGSRLHIRKSTSGRVRLSESDVPSPRSWKFPTEAFEFAEKAKLRARTRPNRPRKCRSHNARVTRQ